MTGAGRVAVLAAMLPELAPVVRRLGLAPLDVDLGDTRAWKGRSGEREVVAAVTRMGTRAAREVTSRVLDRLPAEHVIVLGACGAVAHELAIGDLVVPERVLDEASGAAHHPVALGGAQAAGTLFTSDVLQREPAKLEALRRAGVVAVDMESAAIGAVCEARGVPFSVLRAVSDRAGDPLVGPEVVALSRPDGTPHLGNVLRFVVRRPQRLLALARLGAGLRAAVRSSTEATLAALAALGTAPARRVLP